MKAQLSRNFQENCIKGKLGLRGRWRYVQILIWGFLARACKVGKRRRGKLPLLAGLKKVAEMGLEREWEWGRRGT